MNQRERLEKTFAGEPTDRIPVALWRHWPGDDQRAADLAQATLEFQKTYQWDFVVVTPANHYAVIDHGVQDQWAGSADGTRVPVRRAVMRSLEWTDLRPLDPQRGSLARQSESLRLVCEGLGESVPILPVLYSPLAQAAQIAGQDVLLRHMRMQPDRLRSGLNVITETLLRFLDSLRRLPIAGVCYVVEQASYALMGEDEYRTFGRPYDIKVLESLHSRWWMNILHLRGIAPMFRVVTDYPVQVINWADRDTEPNLAQGKLLFNGALCAGLSNEEHVHLGTPTTVRDAARESMMQMNGRRLILSTGSPIAVTTPLSNIRAVRDAVQIAG